MATRLTRRSMGAWRHGERAVDREVVLDEGAHTRREGNDPAFRAQAVGAVFAVDGEAVGLPVDVVAAQASESRDAQAGVEERPHREAFGVRLRAR
jgi:hypothetical protein